MMAMREEPTLPLAVSTALARYQAAKAEAATQSALKRYRAARAFVALSVGLAQAVYDTLPRFYHYRGIIIELYQCQTESGGRWSGWIVVVRGERITATCSTDGNLISGYIEGIKAGQQYVDQLLSEEQTS